MLWTSSCVASAVLGCFGLCSVCTASAVFILHGQCSTRMLWTSSCVASAVLGCFGLRSAWPVQYSDALDIVLCGPCNTRSLWTARDRQTFEKGAGHFCRRTSAKEDQTAPKGSEEGANRSKRNGALEKVGPTNRRTKLLEQGSRD